MSTTTKVKVLTLALTGTPARLPDSGMFVMEARMQCAAAWQLTDNSQAVYWDVPAAAVEFLPVQQLEQYVWVKGSGTLTIVYIGVERPL